MLCVFKQINDFRFDMAEFASNTSKGRTEKLKINKHKILEYQYPMNIDKSRIGIKNEIKIMVLINYGNKKRSIQVNETLTPTEILGYRKFSQY